ncbi:hypothetical protein ACQ4LE_004337 [Meloidogyne hapla]|uniref:TruB_N domain-containing protein n=1 Tax=Meloidogyne hapla TaxID=6305 RepID=A0A1I8C0U1_MELHA
MPRYSFNCREIQNLLNGIVCLFKPRDIPLPVLQRLFLKEICDQANVLAQCRPIPLIEMPIVEAHKESGALLVVGKSQQIDYSMHPLIVGEMFRPEEFYMEALNPLEPSSSGVCVFGLNDGCDRLDAIRSLAWINEYFIEAELGRGTNQNSIRGKVNARMEYDHVSQHRLNTLLSLLRLQYKKASFEFANINMESQQAFELARCGAPRPKILGSPLIFDLDLCYFNLPYFKLNIQITGENDQFLCDFIHEIGLNLSTVASTRKLRRTRQGFFGIEHALLDKHFHLESILKNILMCEKILAENLEKSLNSDIIEMNDENKKEENKLIIKQKTFLERYKLTNDDLENENLPEPEDCLKLPFGREYKIC